MNRYNVDGPQINWIHFRNAYDNSEKKREINWENLKYIDNWLNDKGYTLPQRQAIIYNIYQESGGNPAAVSKDGRFAGLLQWDTEKGGRYNKIKDKSLDGQLQYIDDTLYGDLAFNGQNWMGMTRDATRANQAKFTNAKTARDAMDILTKGYVRPNKEVSENRMNSFQVYFPIESENKMVPFLEAPRGEYQYTPYNTPAFKNPYIPIQSIDLNTKEGFDNPILQYRVNTKATGGPLTKYDTKIPKEKEQAYAQWVESLPLNLRDDHDYDLRGAFLEGLKPDKYSHMSDKYKKPWHPTFSNESIYSTKNIQGGHWEGDEFIPSPWQEKRQQLINSMNLMEPNIFSNGGTIHIKPENKGKFTAAAKRAGKSVQGYASQILAHPENYSPTLRKRAQFAHNAAKWNACGGKLYPDGGPIDPPWASFVPSQPREPQVVRPQQQVNPYLLGLSVGMGQNEAAKYSTAAQTPEFRQGYYDGQAQAVASEAARAGRAPVVEPGIEAVSPVLSVLPGTGDVKDFADITDYYYNTGDLATSLGLAALTVASPVQGVGKLGKLSNEARALKMLQDAEYDIKHYAERIAEKPKPLGSIDYKIPKGEKVPELNPISKRLEIPYAPGGHSKFKKEAGEQFDKALKEQPKKIKGKDSKKSAEAVAQERVAPTSEIKSEKEASRYSKMSKAEKRKFWAKAIGTTATGIGIARGIDWLGEGSELRQNYSGEPVYGDDAQAMIDSSGTNTNLTGSQLDSIQISRAIEGYNTKREQANYLYDILSNMSESQLESKKGQEYQKAYEKLLNELSNADRRLENIYNDNRKYEEEYNIQK